MPDSPSRNCTIVEIEEMLIIAAKVVDAHGGAHLPLFEMLERQHAAMAIRESTLDRARRLANTPR